MPAKRIGIIDVGSNSIKLLVAEKGTTEPINVVRLSIRETRIGEGIAGNPPAIDEAAIKRGSQAIATLVAEAEEDKVDDLQILATSAVRDAANQEEFIARVHQESGHTLKVLSGAQEAHYIAQGVYCDKTLENLKSFFLIDLGGGSMECIHQENDQIKAARSFQLGAVRLTSKFIRDREQPLARADGGAIATHARSDLENSVIKPNSPALPIILTGGAARIISYHFTQEQRARGVTPAEFKNVSAKICTANKEDRIALHRIPPARADVFPAALQTLETTISYLQANRIYFTACNLRFGYAYTLLS
ncbi:MAG: hypothetical protein AAGB46_08875 [Verrucomicrobiota bacterium]